MNDYAKVEMTRDGDAISSVAVVAAPVSLPEWLGPYLPHQDVTDLADRGYPTIGFWVFTRVEETVDPLTQCLAASPIEAVDMEGRTVTHTYAAIDLTNDMRRQRVVAAGELTPLQFQLRLTQAERVAIRGSSDPEVIDYRELAALAQSINLLDPMTVAGLQLLVEESILVAERVPEILGYTPD